MSSASSWALACAMAWLGAAGLAATPLRVCADPNNLPFSNRQQQGFENRIASLIAADMNTTVRYTWYPQRGEFFKKTLDRGLCDVVMSVPAGMPGTAMTQPYYRSEYVFVTRKNRGLDIDSFDDPRLRGLKIGVHILGDQNDSLPPVQALASRGLAHNMVGFSIFGNLNEKNPPSDLIRAVANGQVDLAVAWGPMAGYFAQHSSVPLRLTPVDGDRRHPNLPFSFDIGIGVRPGDTALRDQLDAELTRRHAQIQQILRAYGIPLDGAGVQEANTTEE